LRAIILAAGRGSRMGEMTDNRPKCLVELQGKPLLEWQLSALHAAGIEKIAIVTGYKRKLLAGYDVFEFYNSRWAETNMVSSLACAGAWLEDSPCIVTYSDIFYGHEAISLLMNSSFHISITYDPGWLSLWKNRFDDPLLDAETFRINSDSSLAEIGCKPSSINEIQGQYMGLLRFSPTGWAEVTRIRAELIPTERDKIDMTGVLQKIIKKGNLLVNAIPYDGDWGEVDSIHDLSIYNEL
jgi:L-glutamine-phosphate cytidylyltransferase